MIKKAALLCIAMMTSGNVTLGQMTNAVAQPITTASTEDLQRRVQQLEAEVAELKSIARVQSSAQAAQSADAPSPPSGTAQTASEHQPGGSSALPTGMSADDHKILDFLHDTTINVGLDGYYSYNFNHPVGRINLLRAYDVSSNSFSLNQASVIFERAPNVNIGRRFGGRLDLQFGQATETLQGNPVNEPRPQVYRPVFQAYGTYVFPVGSGLTVDFGKWASAMGYENNYTKDQFNYSRSYFFDFLPFYHMGFRTTYNVNDRLALGYWLVNGAQQTEDFNGFKSQVVQVILKPTKTVQWNLIYHNGQEQRDLVPALNPGLPTLPTQPGLSTLKISPIPDGRLHILDTYASWNATPKLTLAGEADYVINRVFAHSTPAHVSGGAAYAHYQFTPKVSLTARGEYLSDRGGLFSGVSQALKGNTLTVEYKLADGFLMRYEWRRDFSNQSSFLTDVQDVLSKQQNTATVGLIWWWGRKEGSW
jgi:putative OmpL-like beta-barrel porin-2